MPTAIAVMDTTVVRGARVIDRDVATAVAINRARINNRQSSFGVVGNTVVG